MLSAAPKSTKDVSMNDCFGSDLSWLIEHHAELVASVETLRQQFDNGAGDRGMLGKAVAEEEMVRDKLVRWRPSSILEAQAKLLYLVHFLASTKSSFDTETMSEIVESVDHLR
uniref:hypothetical protein n=1 Tax=Rhizobium sp. RCAM05350 TaxID=2895568 RepID=UPI002076A977|nr:hypothetical protein [Rhizobium sp. RCAM05350]